MNPDTKQPEAPLANALEQDEKNKKRIEVIEETLRPAKYRLNNPRHPITEDDVKVALQEQVNTLEAELKKLTAGSDTKLIADTNPAVPVAEPTLVPDAPKNLGLAKKAILEEAKKNVDDLAEANRVSAMVVDQLNNAANNIPAKPSATTPEPEKQDFDFAGMAEDLKKEAEIDALKNQIREEPETRKEKSIKEILGDEPVPVSGKWGEALNKAKNREGRGEFSQSHIKDAEKRARQERWDKEDLVASPEYQVEKLSHLKNERQIERVKEKASPSMWNPLNWRGVKGVADGVKWLTRRAPVLGSIVTLGAGIPYALKEVRARDEHGENQSFGVRLWRGFVGRTEKLTKWSKESQWSPFGEVGKTYEAPEKRPAKKVVKKAERREAQANEASPEVRVSPEAEKLAEQQESLAKCQVSINAIIEQNLEKPAKEVELLLVNEFEKSDKQHDFTDEQAKIITDYIERYVTIKEFNSAAFEKYGTNKKALLEKLNKHAEFTKEDEGKIEVRLGAWGIIIECADNVLVDKIANTKKGAVQLGKVVIHADGLNTILVNTNQELRKKYRPNDLTGELGIAHETFHIQTGKTVDQQAEEKELKSEYAESKDLKTYVTGRRELALKQFGDEFPAMLINIEDLEINKEKKLKLFFDSVTPYDYLRDVREKVVDNKELLRVVQEDYQKEVKKAVKAFFELLEYYKTMYPDDEKMARQMTSSTVGTQCESASEWPGFIGGIVQGGRGEIATSEIPMKKKKAGVEAKVKPKAENFSVADVQERIRKAKEEYSDASRLSGKRREVGIAIGYLEAELHKAKLREWQTDLNEKNKKLRELVLEENGLNEENSKKEREVLAEQVRQLEIHLYNERGGKPAKVESRPAKSAKAVELRNIEKKVEETQESLRRLIPNQERKELEVVLKEAENSATQLQKKFSQEESEWAAAKSRVESEKDEIKRTRIFERVKSLERDMKKIKSLSELSNYLSTDIVKKSLYLGERGTLNGPDTLEELIGEINDFDRIDLKNMGNITQRDIDKKKSYLDILMGDNNFSSNKVLQDTFKRLVLAKLDKMEERLSLKKK